VPPPVSAGVVRLAWDSNTEPNMDHYLVYYDTASRTPQPYPNAGYPNPPRNVPMQAGLTTTYDLSGLISGQTYYFRVSAVDNVGRESPLSIERSGTAK